MAKLIEDEIQKTIDNNVGINMFLKDVRVESYNEKVALCWLTFDVHALAGSKHENKTWRFTNVYGYRMADAAAAAGWEFVLRDQEVDEMRKATGERFDA